MNVGKQDQKLLASWAADCAERVLPYFEKEYPEDPRPRKAIEHARKWVATGVLKMAEVRKAALDAHTAARESSVPSATFAARAAGQAASVPHVARHALGVPYYAAKCLPPDRWEKEREWELKHLPKHLHPFVFPK